MLFGSSGIRQRFDRPLVETALRVGSSMGAQFPEVVVGMDTRTTSPLISHLLISGITSAGGRAFSAGIAPTPSIAYSTRYIKAGCMVTASHNPEEYNGIKLFNPDGSSFTQSQQNEIIDQITKTHWADWKRQGSTTAIDVITPHKRAILDGTSIPQGLVVVVDCGNGAGSVLTPSLLADAGAKPVCLTCDTAGSFARPSEPLKENLSYIGEMVKKTGAACAVVHDGDADRMMAFDNRGRFIDGDHLLMLFARHLDAKRVVTTSDASMIIEEIADVHRTPVGDTFVSEELLKWGEFGGEPSGAWVFPKHSYCPDGPFAAALFCEIASEGNVAEVLDQMPSYPILRESFACETAWKTVTSLGATNPTDGIRVPEENGWFLIRASGTEPKIRITAEGTTTEIAKQMLERARALVRKGKTA
ncbi:MAG: phosphopentomutase/phosphoglucosamine mutase [Methanoregula sp.]